jgi:hypothetical protein
VLRTTTGLLLSFKPVCVEFQRAAIVRDTSLFLVPATLRLKIWLVHAVIGDSPLGAGCESISLVVLFGQEFGCRIRSE